MAQDIRFPPPSEKYNAHDEAEFRRVLAEYLLAQGGSMHFNTIEVDNIEPATPEGQPTLPPTPGSIVDYTPFASSLKPVRLVDNLIIGRKNNDSQSWDAQVYSTTGLAGGATASVRAHTNHVMFGLNTDPTTNASFSSIDYAFSVNLTGILQFYESGVPVGGSSTWVPGSLLQVIYSWNGVDWTIRWLKDGVVLRTVAASAGLTFYFDSSFLTPASGVDAELRDIQFAGALTADSAITLTGQGTEEGEIVYNIADKKLYRWTGAYWDASVPTADLTGVMTTEQLADLAVSTAKIANDAITAGKIAALAVGESELAALAVTEAKVAANAITTAKIADDAVAAGKIAASAVGPDEIAALAVTEGKVAANAITTAKIADDAVESAKIAALAVGTENLAAGAVTAEKITALTITGAEIAAGAIVAGKIAALSIVAGDIAADAVTASKILAGAVTAGKIDALSIVAGDIATDAITASKIQAGAVTAGKIDALSIVAGDIATDAITSAKILAEAVTAVKIKALDITAAQIATDAITASKIQTDAVTASKIQADAVTAVKIFAGAVTTVKMTADSINGDRIAAGTLHADKIVANSVDFGHIAAGAIRSDELHSTAITAGHIAAGVVSADVITTGTLAAARIAAGSLDASKITVGTITADRIVANSITSGQTEGRARHKVYRSTNQTITTSTETEIVYDSSEYAVGTGGQDLSHGYTILSGQDTGVWAFNAGMSFSSGSTGDRYIVIKKNGTVIAQTMVRASASAGTVLNLHVMDGNAAVGDFYNCYVWHSQGSNLSIGNGAWASYFSSIHLW